MINLGSINGKVEILKDENNGDVALIGRSNLITFTQAEAVDLAFVIDVAASDSTDAIENYRSDNFQPKG